MNDKPILTEMNDEPKLTDVIDWVQGNDEQVVDLIKTYRQFYDAHLRIVGSHCGAVGLHRDFLKLQVGVQPHVN